MEESKSHIYYIVFDWETGGFSSAKNPVVELAMVALRGDNFEEIGRVDDIIVPYDKKGEVVSYDFEENIIQEINKSDSNDIKEFKKESNALMEEHFDFVYTEGAMRVHGVKEDDFLLRGIEIKELVDKIIQLASAAKISNYQKAVLVGHNPDFDRNFLQQVFEICKKTSNLPKIFAGSNDHYGNFQPHMIDTIDLAKLKWHKNEDEIVNYKLETCVNNAGLELVGSHRAINDVIATKDLLLYFKQCLRGNSSDNKEESRFRDKLQLEY